MTALSQGTDHGSEGRVSDVNRVAKEGERVFFFSTNNGLIDNCATPACSWNLCRVPNTRVYRRVEDRDSFLSRSVVFPCIREGLPAMYITYYVYHIHILHFALCWVCRYLYRPLDLLLHGLLRIVRTKVVQRDLVRVFMRAGDADEVCFLTLFRARSVVQCSKEFDNTAERQSSA